MRLIQWTILVVILTALAVAKPPMRISIGMSATIPTAKYVTRTEPRGCIETSQYRQFSWAIAKQEGFFIKGTIPSRLHNPGDLKAVYGYRFPGQVGTDRHGHVIFRNDNAGWAALQNQVRKMCASEGKYSADMSIQQIGRKYAKDWKRWSANVAGYLKCSPRATLAELFDIPPVLRVKPISIDLIDQIPLIPSGPSDMDRANQFLIYQMDSLDTRRAQGVA